MKKIRKRNVVLRTRKLIKKPTYTNNRIINKKKTIKKGLNSGVELKTKNYYFNYDILKQKMHIHVLDNTSKRTNTPELIKLYSVLLKKAKEKNVKEITAKTWIFYQHPKLAEKLGFKIVKYTDFHIKRIMKKYPDYTIKKASFDNLKNKPTLVIMHKKTKVEKEISFSKINLPMYVKKI